MTMRMPIGPVGIITPWNTPFMLATWKIAPALAMSCTVVHKPAELSPLSCALLAEIAHEAGLPRGFGTVQGFGETAGKALSEHPLSKPLLWWERPLPDPRSSRKARHSSASILNLGVKILSSFLRMLISIGHSMQSCS